MHHMDKRSRLLTFAYPLHYQLTKTKSVLILGVAWLIPFILAIPALAGILNLSRAIRYNRHSFLCLISWHGDLWYKLVLLFTVLIIPTILVIICFCGSFHLARSTHKHMKVENCRIHQGNNSYKDAQWKRDLRLFKMLSIMTGGFYIAWLPYVVTMAIPELLTGHTLHPIIDYIAPRLAGSNSFWNPIIYFFTLRPFSRALSELCSCNPCAQGLASSGSNTHSYNSRSTEVIDERDIDNPALVQEPCALTVQVNIVTVSSLVSANNMCTELGDNREIDNPVLIKEVCAQVMLADRISDCPLVPSNEDMSIELGDNRGLGDTALSEESYEQRVLAKRETNTANGLVSSNSSSTELANDRGIENPAFSAVASYSTRL